MVGYRPYLDLISDLLPGKAVYSSGMGGEVDRVKAAVELMEKGSVALVSSGDANVYGMAGLGLEIAPRPDEVQIIPAVTSFTAAACWADLSSLRERAVVSLSNLLTPWLIEAPAPGRGDEHASGSIQSEKPQEDWAAPAGPEMAGERDVLIARNVGRAERRYSGAHLRGWRRMSPCGAGST